ncbi:hypothetical protein PpBr36_04095 [Pyricularia pennisetigena]|uniref:hypothetical protein n=1 Tax=Pyricularia pennisetigena TaxID=1578925 RepID=UPI001150FA64|nr:hypothetical protein PpBr36_04095 [Pyricularia pennisetigena]TLS26254.1 hypothetical protein PpBr36_04095 [Pyricularia pennisetigena]
MRYSLGTLLLALSQGIYADCGWRLNGNDCICMNSANGNAWAQWTGYCCQAMGRRTGGYVSEAIPATCGPRVHRDQGLEANLQGLLQVSKH